MIDFESVCRVFLQNQISPVGKIQRGDISAINIWKKRMNLPTPNTITSLKKKKVTDKFDHLRQLDMRQLLFIFWYRMLDMLTGK